MTRILKLNIFLISFLTLLLPTLTQSFNPVTHIYIAEKVFPEWGYNFDLYYGSLAPDIAMYVMQAEKWSTAYEDTHRDFIHLTPRMRSQAQRAFKDGWLTHNGVWGADYYAHGEFPESEGGYVIIKAADLLHEIGSISGDYEKDRAFAHAVIEAAIDLLLRTEHPELGLKLVGAITSRSSEDRDLLIKTFIRNWKNKRTDLLTFTLAEHTFRDVVLQYASAINSSNLDDMSPMGELGSMLALEVYGIDITSDEMIDLLQVAVSLCQEDYLSVIMGAIEGIKSHLP
jgi:hypothetical protein